MKNPVCPKCGFVLPELQQARAGRAGRGKSKARSSEQARAAALARWDSLPGWRSRQIEREIANEAALPAIEPANPGNKL